MKHDKRRRDVGRSRMFSSMLDGDLGWDGTFIERNGEVIA